MTAIDRSTSKGQLVPLVFGQDAVAASQTNVQLPVAVGEGSQAVDGYIAPFPYEIVGVSYATDTAVTAGTLTIGATIGGTEDADTTVTVTGGTGSYKRVPRGKARGNAGDRIGCEITTDANFLPVTADLTATVWVLLYLTGI